MDGKKISFGFSKIIKKPQIGNLVKKEEVELIECLEGKTIKTTENQVIEKEIPLIIPLKNDASPLEKLIEQKKHVKINQTPEEIRNGAHTNEDKKPETIEQRAAREILEESQNLVTTAEPLKFAVPLKADDLPLNGAQEPTIDDYDKIPIQQFGLAMLRGMGWKDEEHKKKKENEDDIVVCRPKGLGLGADKVVKPKTHQSTTTNSAEELKIKINAYIKILGGKYMDAYGQIEGMDEESGRMIVKLARGGNRESINEFLIQPVTEKEYMQNRKVLNVAKYEEFKNKQDHNHEYENVQEDKIKHSKAYKNSENSRSKDSKHHKDNSSKKSSRKSKYYSDEDVDEEQSKGSRSHKSSHRRSKYDDKEYEDNSYSKKRYDHRDNKEVARNRSSESKQYSRSKYRDKY